MSFVLASCMKTSLLRSSTQDIVCVGFLAKAGETRATIIAAISAATDNTKSMRLMRYFPIVLGQPLIRLLFLQTLSMTGRLGYG